MREELYNALDEESRLQIYNRIKQRVHRDWDLWGSLIDQLPEAERADLLKKARLKVERDTKINGH